MLPLRTQLFSKWYLIAVVVKLMVTLVLVAPEVLGVDGTGRELAAPKASELGRTQALA